MVNLKDADNPLYVPVELGKGQSTHETSSYPGFRLLDPARGITEHSGIDLRGVWDSNVVAAANGSSALLRYHSQYGLVIDNGFAYDGIQYKNQLGHLEGQATLMSFLKNFGTAGVSFDGKQLNGLIAGTVLGNVGNTGYSMGDHLDWNTYQNGSVRPTNPLKSTLYGSYLSNNITANLEARYLSGLTNNSIKDNEQQFKDYYYATRDTDFFWNYSLRYGIGW